ncbi:chaplin [Streptomyces sp. NPDC046909]|uniref:chaplin n=1 Tax=Streptomyces sp. NPDC046909 TaxID=3155617 RepID=UPI0033D190A8
MAVTVPAYADSAADGSAADSPGLVSGNAIRLPVRVPVNACGNTVSVVGLLNPAARNSCAEDSAEKEPAGESGGVISAGDTQDSPGVVSGIGIQVPMDLPVNVSGNTVNVVGVGDPVLDNASVSGDEPVEQSSQPNHSVPEPVEQVPPPFIGDPFEPPMTHSGLHPTQRTAQQPVALSHLADTGTDGVVPAAAASAALVLGGAALRRSFRSAQS